MASKFEQFLQENQIDARRVITASREVERLRPVDRQIKLKKYLVKAGKAGEGAQAPTDKRRSGRPVTQRLLNDLAGGKRVSGAAKTRLLRAVNRLLEQKKKDPIDLRVLF
jgi:hypothetical protein